MSQRVYKEMFDVMKNRRGPYTGIDIPEFYDLVEELFTPQEAEVNNAMPPKPATAEEIAAEMSRDGDEIKAILEAMADRGLCKTWLKNDVRVYTGEPFVPGIFEYQFMSGKVTERERRIARLIHTYKQAFNTAKGDVKLTFPTSRVITVDRTIDAGNTVHTYDQVSTYIEKNETMAVGTCYCRQAASLVGEDIHDLPLDVCMWFGSMAEYAIERLGARKTPKEEARKTLDMAEEAGLVHMSRNTTDNVNFICNCDRWHCEAINRVLKQSKPALFFNSGFQPKFVPDLCTACETCIDRCPPEALAMGDNDVPVVNLDRCFGCAVCATGCPTAAISMESKPDFPVPPKDPRELVASYKASLTQQA